MMAQLWIVLLGGMLTIFSITAWIRARRRRREGEDMWWLWMNTEPKMDVGVITAGLIDCSVMWTADYPIDYEIVDDPEDVRIHRFDRLLAPVILDPWDMDPVEHMRADMGGAIDDVTGGKPLM